MQTLILPDLISIQLRENPLEVCLAEKSADSWMTYSTAEVVDKINRLSCALLDAGIRPGDKVGIVSYNSPAWIIADLAILQLGAIDVPMYPNSTTEDYRYIIKHAGVNLVFAGDEELREKLEPVEGITLMNFNRDDFQAWLNHPLDRMDEVVELRSKVSPEDVASIIYTSGTTGSPKGVMLCHRNIVSNVISLKKIIDEAGGLPGDRVLSFLPLSHIFERCGFYEDIYMGASIYFAESMDTIGDNIREVSPHILRCVPRLLEKIFERIVSKGHELSPVKKSLFFWAMTLAEKYSLEDPGSLIYRAKLSVADKLILSKWREALGGEVKLIVSGAASLRPSLVNIFWAAGIPIYEGYGLTETSPGVAVSRPGAVRPGCVGPPIDDVEVKIEPDGEILVKGPNVMLGYYRDEESTLEVFRDGWFCTGDIGEITVDGLLKITDRKKEMFKTSGGKYIAPQPIEVKLKESLYIEQAMVIGENEKFPAVLISPEMEQLSSYMKRHHIADEGDDLINHPRIKELFQREVDHSNQSFARYEQIKQFRIVPGAWTVESGLVTPKLSIKRRVIFEKYQSYVDDIYSKS